MTSFVFANDFSTTLAAALTTGGTSISVTSTTSLPTLATGKIFPVVLLDQATESVYEVCYCTAISGSTLTVTRGQENTTAQAWSIGDYIYCAPTAGTVAPVGEYAFNGSDSANTVSFSASATLTVDQSGLHFLTSGLGAAGVATLPASPVAGNNYAIDSNASYQVSINPNGGTFLFPDGSTLTSYHTLPLAYGSTNYVFFDGTYWHLFQTGNTIVANAVNGNEALALGQTSFVQGSTNSLTGTSVSTANSFSPITNETVLVVANGGGSGVADIVSITVTGGTIVGGSGNYAVGLGVAVAAVKCTAGVPVTITSTNAPGGTAALNVGQCIHRVAAS